MPFLGICFGFQLAIVAYARNVCKLRDSNSTELDPDTKYPVVDYMPEQRTIQDMGGTMRLGSHDITIMPNSLAYEIYGVDKIRKRHRHRYEFNQNYHDLLTKSGLILSAYSDGGRRTEILEVPNCRFYFAVQFHAEFNSRPGKPEAAFKAFVRASAMK
jgi:CTP synthase